VWRSVDPFISLGARQATSAKYGVYYAGAMRNVFLSMFGN